MHFRQHGVHGYRLSSELGASRGSVYTTLSRLLDAGLVEVEEEDGTAAEEERRQPRRIYRITPKGLGLLAGAKQDQLRRSPFNRYLA